MTHREYTTAGGLDVKTKNSKKIWAGFKDLENLHVTRNNLYWLETPNENKTRIAKIIDPLDADQWLMDNGYKQDTTNERRK